MSPAENKKFAFGYDWIIYTHALALSIYIYINKHTGERANIF